MWFSTKKQQNNNVTIDSCQAVLESIHSNGVDLSLTELLQYQTKSALINLTAKKNIHGKQSGNYLSRSKGRGMEFDEVRHYQIGDDTRAIDWRVTARTGKTHTKLFREEIERPVLIATDLSNSMRFGSKLLFKSVQAAHFAALVAWHAKGRGDRIGGLVFSNSEHIELKPRSRKAGVLHYLHALTQLNNKPKITPEQTDLIADFADHCARLRQLAKPGSLVYLITDGQALLNNADQQNLLQNKQQDALRHLMRIAQHCELVVCLINDPLELSLPETSIKLTATLTDGMNRQQLTLGDKSTAINYQRQAAAQSKEKQQALSKVGARVVYFSAGESLESQLKSNSNYSNNKNNGVDQ
jgi:uncharacterized protein (DUF58 family)